MLARMTGGVGCPDENALVRFSTGQLSGTDLGSLEAHLDGCGACRSLIAQLASLGAVQKQTGGTALGDAPALRHGRVGRYQVERLVGGGGMGMVYAARDQELNRVVAIKLLRTSALGNLESRTRLLREAQTMAKLSHPNLVPIFELGSDQGDDFLAMELIDGPTLDLWLRERKRGWREVVQIFIEAGRGLEAAHQAGVVHRDFKPGNVLVGPDGRARVTDFGLARPMASALATGAGPGSIELTREGSLLGTPAYMSPEQLEGQVADVRSDQFSFCVCLAEALVGHRPFAGRTPEQLRTAMRSGKPPQLELESARLKRVLLKGMSIAPDARFNTIGELLEELAVSLKPSRANPRAVAGALALSVVLAAGAGTAWQQVRPPAAVAVAISRTVRVAAGQQVTVSLPGVQAVRVVDEDVVEARAIGNQRISMTGLSPGRTLLKLQTRAGPDSPLEPLEWEVVVEDQGTQELRFTLGADESLTIPGVTRISAGDPDILEVGTLAGTTVPLKPLKAGSTTLIAWRGPNSARLEWRVTVVGPAQDDNDGVVRKSLRLPSGAQWVLDLPGMQRVAVGDSEIADVKTTGDDKLIVIGGKPGRTTLIVWTATASPGDQPRLEWDVWIEEASAAAPAKGAEAVRKRIALFVGAQRVLTIPEIARVAVGDGSIADVKTIGNNQLLVIGAGPGTTTLIVWTNAGNPGRLEWDIEVAGEKPRPK